MVNGGNFWDRKKYVRVFHRLLTINCAVDNVQDYGKEGESDEPEALNVGSK